MQKQSAKKQTLLLTITNIFVRALGFVMRIILTRFMGAQAIGIMELASSAHMLAITPVTAGIPLAISRLTAKANEEEAMVVFKSAKRLVNKIAFIIIPVMLVLSPWIAELLGDSRTFPSIIMCIPCVWILGQAAVHNGFCYGRSNATMPALSELIEQVVRFLLSLLLLVLFQSLSLSWLAAIPSFATMVAEAVGLTAIVGFMKPPKHIAPSKEIEGKLFRLAMPPTLMRLCNTLLRSVNAVLIPLQLKASGLAAAEATASFGRLSGMVMPVLFLPSVITGSLAMVSAPKMASLEKRPRQLKQTAVKILLFATAIGSLCAIGLYLFAPTISLKLYRQAELTDLIRFTCPSVVFLSISQVLNGMIAGIGRQKHALYASLASACITVLFNLFLTPLPQFRIYGAAFGMMAGQLISLSWNLVLLIIAIEKAQNAANDGISA